MSSSPISFLVANPPHSHAPEHMESSISIQRASPITPLPLTDEDRDKTTRFLLPPKKDYQHQYSDLYRARLRAVKAPFVKQLTPIIDQKNESIQDTQLSSQLTQDGEDLSTRKKGRSSLDGHRRRGAQSTGFIGIRDRIPDCAVGQRSLAIGVTYKNMPKKPSTLENFQQFNHIRIDARYYPEFDQQRQRFEYFNTKTYCDKDGVQDQLALEDDQGRVNLVFHEQSVIYNGIGSDEPAEKPSIASFVSGMVIAVEGSLLETGDFLVDIVYYPSLSLEHLPHAGDNPSEASELPLASGPMMALLYDLDLSSIAMAPSTSSNAKNTTTEKESAPSAVPTIPRAFDNASLLATHELLVDFLTGSYLPEASHSNVESVSPTQLLSPSISHTFIVGNLVNIAHQDHLREMEAEIAALQKQHGTLPRQQLQRIISKFKSSFSGVKSADRFLTRLCSTMDVTLVPSTSDPTNYSLPQQPLHPCLFTQASTYSTLHGETNPCHVFLQMPSSGSSTDPSQRLSVCATDGAAVVNITMYSNLSFLSAAILTLRCRHFAPTAPDTLPIYPHSDHDCMAIIDVPDVYLVGGAPAFQSTTIRMSSYPLGTSAQDTATGDLMKTHTKDVTIICIPSFAKTKTIVLLDPTTRRVLPVVLQQDITDEVDPDTLMFASTLTGKDGDVFDSWDSVHALIDFGSDLNDEGDMS